ncbi:synaptic vesicle glycoprotein 2C-like [Bacillus rossius redtenbacheri]|uniref:synaptic vesicle glycoprotein 2C-like n=1 Tax=Bacillus rossius redtenbacheri TaxID=93214 RepID=UPI002FDE86EA
MEELSLEEAKRTKFVPVDIDTAIQLTGFGWFHCGLVLVCGACFMSAGFQNGLNAYILPAAQCDLGLSSGEKGALNAAFIMGSVCGTFVWGSLADTVGRKHVLVASLLIDSVVTLLSSFVQAYQLFAVCRFFSGFIIGAPSCLVFPYLSEFHTASRGSASICLVGFFWTLSWVLLPALAWVVIPITWAYHAPHFVFNSWRLFVAMLSVPSLISALSLLLLFPESPQFLHASGRSGAALAVLQHMFSKNTGRPAAQYQVRELKRMPRASVQCDTEGQQPHCKLQLVENIVRELLHQAKRLLVAPLLPHTALCAVLLFTNMFGYFGLGLWLPELFNRLETFYATHPNESISVCELSRISQLNASLEDLSTGPKCSGNMVESYMFVNNMIIGAACMLGNILSSLLAGSLGLKAISITTMIIAGCSGISVYFMRSSVQNLIVSCVFLACISTANFVLTGIVVEIFPTSIRGMATCFAILSGRIGAIVSNLIFGELLDISCEVPIFLVGSVVIGGGLLGFLLSKKQETGMT